MKKSVKGETDLDILVDENHYNDVSRIIRKYDFIRLEAASYNDYPCVENYVGIDWKTGKMVHLHIHYRLILGSSNTKEFRIPWENHILNSRVKDSQTGVYRTESSLEYLLLLVRYSIKIRTRNLFLGPFGMPIIRGSVKQEFSDLQSKLDEDKYIEHIRKLLGEKYVSDLLDYSDETPTQKELYYLKIKLKSSLSDYKRFGTFTNKFLGTYREFRKLFAVGIDKTCPKYLYSGRRIANGGYLIAFIGTDGSGKSTLSREIESWLSWKMSAKRVYFGHGESSRLNPILYPLKLEYIVNEMISGKENSEKDKCIESEGNEQITPTVKKLYDTWKPIRSVLISIDQRLKFKIANNRRNNGMVAIGDRYPQNQGYEHIDGPYLKMWDDSNSIIKRWLFKFENSIYQREEEYPPDLIIKLDITRNTSEKRGEYGEKAEKNIEEIRDVEIENTEMVTIDANNNLEDVILDAKREIWKKLS